MSDPTLLSVFGLVVQTPISDQKTQGLPLKTYKLDSYRVEDFGFLSRLTCSCQRSSPTLVVTRDLTRSHPVAGRFACLVCLKEDREAKSASERVAAWLAQNKPSLNQEEHLLLPKQFQRLVDTDGIIMRPRRFVYSKFYGVQLQTKDKVLPTCECEVCVNPYHMMRKLSPASKVTPQMKNDVFLWLNKKMSNKSIQLLLETKYCRTISLRTITNLKKSVLA